MVARSRVHPLAYIPALLMLLLILMPMGLSSLASTELALTNKRILGRVRKQRLSIPFEMVDSITLRRGLMGLIFNYGSLTISGEGLRVRFPGIMAATDMKAMMDKAVEESLFSSLLSKEKEVSPAEPPPSERAREPVKAQPKAPVQADEPAIVEEKKPRRHQDPDQW